MSGESRCFVLYLFSASLQSARPIRPSSSPHTRPKSMSLAFYILILLLAVSVDPIHPPAPPFSSPGRIVSNNFGHHPPFPRNPKRNRTETLQTVHADWMNT